MKNSIWVSALLIFGSGLVLTACESIDQKVEIAEANVVTANEELTQAIQNYLVNVEIYQQFTAERMAANNQKIANLRIKMAEGSMASKPDFIENIGDLENKNSELELRLYYNYEHSINNWEAFKIDLKDDREKLGIVLRDLTANSN